MTAGARRAAARRAARAARLRPDRPARRRCPAVAWRRSPGAAAGAPRRTIRRPPSPPGPAGQRVGWPGSSTSCLSPRKRSLSRSAPIGPDRLAEAAQQFLAPGLQLVDQRLLLLGRLDQRRPLRGVGRLLVPVADTPPQAGARLPEAGQVLLDELELFGQPVGTHGWLSPASRGLASRGPASRGGGGNRSCAAAGYSPGMRSAAICLTEPP